MKKLFTYLTVMMALAAMPLFTSCDARFWEDVEDRAEARTLEGTWTGYIDTYFYDRFGLSGDTYRTSMYFERENSYGGWGYEVDYNTYSRYDDYYYCEFRWEVINGAIRIRYADSWNDVYIYDYVLDDTMVAMTAASTSASPTTAASIGTIGHVVLPVVPLKTVQALRQVVSSQNSRLYI